ncbi:hypothetical protein HNQ59_003737 [Chitinivorax tropicus]|uniref:Short-chain dehydrogenase n=1 Tax=Chitinivorax tropicus TaxID=714531 RepID=A0A840MP51_9PROT|nr:hypothetical protein [Chitinivorax tropicus]MBB5020418.1 hypothetical protein [Chitinivorax tropicus]
MKYQHGLVMGGTGMLSAAAVALARQSTQLTLVARTDLSLQRLAAQVARPELVSYQLRLDWSNRALFIDGIHQHLAQVGMPDVMLCWLHEDDCLLDLALGIPPLPAPMRVIHVRSSAISAPGQRVDPVKAYCVARPDLAYQQVVLGFKLSGDTSRWLTHQEICQGVLTALDHPDKACLTVGVTTPWERRP